MNLLMACWLGVMSLEDLREKQVKISVLLVGGVALCVKAVVEMFAGGADSVKIVSALLPGLFLLLLGFATGKIGYADGIVVLFLGIFLGGERVLYVLCVSLVVMGVLCLLLLSCRRVERQTRLPFFPFLLLGFLIVALGGGALF